MGLTVDHSIFALVKFATIASHPDLSPFVPIYMRSMAVLCLLVYFLRIWRLPTLNQIVILSTLSIVIPPVSFEYTLLSLYGSFAILCVASLRAPAAEQRTLLPYFLLYAMIFTPESYIYLHGIRWAGPFHGLCLLALVFLALAKPLPASLGQDAELAIAARP